MMHIWNSWIISNIIWKIYKINDFVGENNDHAIQELIDSWEAWLEETFGENWDEI